SLKNLGVGERKSLVVKPANIPSQFTSAYWRGYFDGDGHINVSETSRVAELTGNKFMLNGFAKYLEKLTGIKSKLQKDKSVYRLRYSRRSFLSEISKILYLDSKIHLDRKY